MQLKLVLLYSVFLSAAIAIQPQGHRALYRRSSSISSIVGTSTALIDASTTPLDKQRKLLPTLSHSYSRPPRFTTRTRPADTPLPISSPGSRFYPTTSGAFGTGQSTLQGGLTRSGILTGGAFPSSTPSASGQNISSNITWPSSPSLTGYSVSPTVNVPGTVASSLAANSANVSVTIAPSAARTTTMLSITPVPSVTPSSAQLPATLISSASNPLLSGCGAVSVYYGQKPQDWVANSLDVWLNTWVGQHVADIAANPAGFTGSFANWAIGNPDFSCRDDGSSSDCDFNPCDIATLNNKGSEIREAYYVMESLSRIHTYFMGMREGFTVSAIGAALSKDNWAMTFYKDKDVKQVQALREVLNALTMIVGVGAAFAGLGPVIVGVAASAGAALFAGALGSVSPLIGQHQDDTFNKAADLGGILGQIVVGAIEGFTSANNILMHGQNYLGTGDLRDYLKGGAFVDFLGVDKNAVTDKMNAFLVGQAVNSLYRKQKIFILGGGSCDDNQGIGAGPKDYMLCRDGKAWYLYYWQENNVISLTAHQWGWVAVPPGADQLGKGAYAGVTVQDLISSSLDAYNVAGYSYTNDTAIQRAESAIRDQWANPGALGPAWEGIFTIPVCDVSAMIPADVYAKQYILEQYGHDNRPVWCGPICSGDLTKTQEFIRAANMQNFQSPKHLCPDDPGY